MDHLGCGYCSRLMAVFASAFLFPLGPIPKTCSRASILPRLRSRNGFGQNGFSSVRKAMPVSLSRDTLLCLCVHACPTMPAYTHTHPPTVSAHTHTHTHTHTHAFHQPGQITSFPFWQQKEVIQVSDFRALGNATSACRGEEADEAPSPVSVGWSRLPAPAPASSPRGGLPRCWATKWKVRQGRQLLPGSSAESGAA